MIGSSERSPIWDMSLQSDGRQRAAPSRHTAGAGAQTQDHLGRIHSDPPRVARRDGHFRGRGPYTRIGSLLRAVFLYIWRALGLTFRGSQTAQQALETTSDSKRTHT